MLKKLSNLFLVLIAATTLVAMPVKAQDALSASSESLCMGTLYNPFTDLNWAYFSMSIFGMPVYVGGMPNPPEMFMPPVCWCLNFFGIQIPGIGVTYWEPAYLEEVVRHPGCLIALGGLNILPGFQMLASANNDSSTKSGADASTTQRSQVHFYEWPVFYLLDLFESFLCVDAASVNLSWLTEIDPFWASSAFSQIIGMEGALFANPVATMASFVDKPVFEFTASGLLPLINVVGESTVYPFEGNSSATNSSWQANRQLGNRFLARQSRLGLLWTSIGPLAYCNPYPSPFLEKNQFRPDPFWPIKTQGLPIGLGSSTLLQYPPVTNLPGFEDTGTTLWTGRQCCLL